MQIPSNIKRQVSFEKQSRHVVNSSVFQYFTTYWWILGKTTVQVGGVGLLKLKSKPPLITIDLREMNKSAARSCIRFNKALIECECRHKVSLVRRSSVALSPFHRCTATLSSWRPGGAECDKPTETSLCLKASEINTWKPRLLCGTAAGSEWANRSRLSFSGAEQDEFRHPGQRGVIAQRHQKN